MVAKKPSTGGLMVEIPSPIERVLTVVDEDEVDQPRPAAPHYGEQDGEVPVATACEACGCRWVTDPDAVIPNGAVDCAFCGMMRGRTHRDASLTEFENGASASSEASSTIQYQWADESPSSTGPDLLEYSRLLVLADPTRDYVDELVALCSRCPYERHLYLSDEK